MVFKSKSAKRIDAAAAEVLSARGNGGAYPRHTPAAWVRFTGSVDGCTNTLLQATQATPEPLRVRHTRQLPLFPARRAHYCRPALNYVKDQERTRRESLAQTAFIISGMLVQERNAGRVAECADSERAILAAARFLEASLLVRA